MVIQVQVQVQVQVQEAVGGSGSVRVSGGSCDSGSGSGSGLPGSILLIGDILVVTTREPSLFSADWPTFKSLKTSV